MLANIDPFENTGDKSYFDEGPRPKSIRALHSTREIDQYRQGIEISSMLHYGAGIVKIHAGEPGHRIKQSTFGDCYSDKSKVLVDEISIDPVKFVEGVISPPIKISDIDDHYAYNGVIEPFDIRSKVTLFNVSEYEKDISGALINGNFNNGYSDIIVEEYDVEFEQNDVYYNDFTGVTRHVISEKPFDDSSDSVIDLIAGGNDVIDVVNSLLLNNKDYDIIVNNTKVCGTGCLYDGKRDSIAFGGMTYT